MLAGLVCPPNLFFLSQGTGTFGRLTVGFSLPMTTGWKRLFDVCWRDFSTRLTTILTNLARNRDLVDREAASFEIVESKALRRELKEQTEKRDRDRQDESAREVFHWLDLAGQDREQDDFLESCQSTRAPGTCQWFMKHRKTLTWFDEQDPRMVLWLKGKPGSGKSRTQFSTFHVPAVSPKVELGTNTLQGRQPSRRMSLRKPPHRQGPSCSAVSARSSYAE